MNPKISSQGKRLGIFTAVFLLMSAALPPCTFFMSTLNGRTYFGNNEDSGFDQTNVWFIPGEGGKHGYVCFGYNTGFPQGGMNDQGLCFDAASTPRVNIWFSPDKKAGNFDFLFRIMADCSAVEEVAEIIRTTTVPGLKFQGQLMFADKQGNAVGEKVETEMITIIPPARPAERLTVKSFDSQSGKLILEVA